MPARRTAFIVATALATACLPLLLAAHAAGGREIRVADAKAFNDAAKDLKPGDTLLLAPGVWKDAALRVRAFGTADAPVTVRAEVPGKTVLSGDSNFRISGSFVIVDGLAFQDFKDESHIFAFRTKEGEEATDSRLTNTSFDRPLPGEKDADTSTYWVSMYGKRNRVDHCYFEGKRTHAPTLTVWVNTDNTSDDHRIDHNHFAGRPPLGKNGGETMRVGTSQVSMHNSRTLVERNLFTNCDGESEIISNKSCENVYRNNVFLASKGALVLRHGNRCRVEGNFFLGDGVEGTAGIRVIGEDHVIVNNYLQGLLGKEFESALPINDGIPNSPANGYFRVKRLTLAHNTLVDCFQSISFGVGTGARNRIEQADDVLVANNLLVSTRGPLIRFLSTPTNVRWAGNVVWAGGKDPQLPVTGQGLTISDPGLVAEGSLQRPPTASLPPAPLATPLTTDALGRPRGSTVTPGALEPGTNAALPVTKADVGPEWRRTK